MAGPRLGRLLVAPLNPGNALLADFVDEDEYVVTVDLCRGFGTPPRRKSLWDEL
jgi:hypothetical protein